MAQHEVGHNTGRALKQAIDNGYLLNRVDFSKSQGLLLNGLTGLSNFGCVVSVFGMRLG